VKNGIDKELKMKAQLEKPDFIKEQERIWDSVKKNLASGNGQTAAPEPTPVDDGPWTTVENKKAIDAANEKASIVIHQTANNVNPDKLRNLAKVTPPSTVSAAASKKNATQAPKKPNNATLISIPTVQKTTQNSSKKNFLNWCKSEMKLSSGIKFTDIIEVLLMLPDGPDGREIIADTINSNSNFADGRKFAVEFAKRKREVEADSKDFLSWNEALKIYQNGNETDWDFQVVTKKKKNTGRA